jgi:hypothetical protein|tara:strand:- start:471 stop:1082 length:612 start_codon:yes stop_codon:yes gene_type:complete
MKKLFILLFFSSLAVADATNNGANNINQTSTSGSQTSISGGYSQETTNNYTGGQTNSTTNSTQNTTNSNQETAVNPANAPAMSVYSQDSCSLTISSGFSVIGFSFSGGGYVITDEACERLKKAKMLKALSMTVASISIMCDDPAVFDAMYRSGTPCPVMKDGKSLIGEEAMKVIYERRKPTDDKVEQYRRYKESLTNNGKNPK